LHIHNLVAFLNLISNFFLVGHDGQRTDMHLSKFDVALFYFNSVVDFNIKFVFSLSLILHETTIGAFKMTFYGSKSSVICELWDVLMGLSLLVSHNRIFLSATSDSAFAMDIVFGIC
jgi:hypothetical protein